VARDPTPIERLDAKTPSGLALDTARVTLTNTRAGERCVFVPPAINAASAI